MTSVENNLVIRQTFEWSTVNTGHSFHHQNVTIAQIFIFHFTNQSKIYNSPIDQQNDHFKAFRF